MVLTCMGHQERCWKLILRVDYLLEITLLLYKMHPLIGKLVGNSRYQYLTHLNWYCYGLADDEIVIATTSADPWETETFKIVSVSGNVVTLNDTARFDHIGKSWKYYSLRRRNCVYEHMSNVVLLASLFLSIQLRPWFINRWCLGLSVYCVF